jgi:UPF0176 protein
MCDECATEMKGACCDTCKVHPRKREFNGTGYYTRFAID